MTNPIKKIILVVLGVTLAVTLAVTFYSVGRCCGCVHDTPNTQDLCDMSLDTCPVMYIDSTYRYDFINAKANVVIDSLGTLNPIFESLRELRRMKHSYMEMFYVEPKKVSILHVGDSHIQAGYFTDVMMNRLHSDFGDGGRGLVLPYNLIKQFEPIGYRIESYNKWAYSRCVSPKKDININGIGGFVLETANENISFNISTRAVNGLRRYDFDKIAVIHNDTRPIKISDNKIIDSSYLSDNYPFITNVILREPVNNFEIKASIPYTDGDNSAIYGFVLGNSKPGVIYHSVGANGACFIHFGRNQNFMRQTQALSPNLIVVSFGTNEASGRNFIKSQFVSQMHQFISRIKAANPKSVLLMTTPIEIGRKIMYKGGRVEYRTNQNSEMVREAIVEYAFNNGIAFWDFYTVAGANGASEKWVKASLMLKDVIHLTKKGYSMQGTLLYTALMDSYNQYVIKNTTHYSKTTNVQHYENTDNIKRTLL